MAVNKETFSKFAKDLEPVGTVLKVVGAGFTCLTAGIGTFMKIRELIKAAKAAGDNDEIDLDELGNNFFDEELKPIVPEEVDDDDFGNLFGGKKESVE